MKRIIFYLLFTISMTNVFCQVSCNKEILTFLKEEGEVKQEDKASAYAFELIKNTSLSDADKCGIYRIGTFADHSFTYLLLLDNGKKQFVNCHTNLSETLETVFTFFETYECKFTDADKLLYIKKIINIYENNMNVIPW